MMTSCNMVNVSYVLYQIPSEKSENYLEGAGPVPVAASGAHAQLEALGGVVPVEGRAHARLQLPHRLRAPLCALHSLAALVDQRVAAADADHLRVHTSWLSNTTLS